MSNGDSALEPIVDRNAPIPRSRNRRIAAGLLTGLALNGWIAFAALMMNPYFDVERTLMRTFPSIHGDAYSGLNRATPVALCLASIWLTLAALYAWFRRTSSLIVLAIGPILSALFLAPVEDWTDPAWFTIVSVMDIGAVVSIVFSLFWIGSLARLESRDQRAQGR